MPDANARERVPADWGQALSALPLETPPAGGWERLSPRLPRPRPHSPPHWRRWSAAAALLAAMALPWLAWKRPATDPATTTIASQPAQETVRAVAAGHAPAKESPASTALPETRAAPPVAVASTPARRVRAHAAAESRAQPAPAMESLYAESALLEELLTQAQPSPVASGPAMVVSEALQGHLADIDAALSAPALDGDDRRALWTQRVETLRQLAGVESTQRWLATEGGTGFISSVY